jgi:hypothetical protein
VLLWLPAGLKVFLSLSISMLAFEAAEAAEKLSVGRSSVSVSRLSRFGLMLRADIVQVQGAEMARFRFCDGRFSEVDGGEIVSGYSGRADS